MGYKHDQRTPAEVSRSASGFREESPPPAYTPSVPSASSSVPYRPPLPPRASEAPPLYHSQPLTSSWSAQDPRKASTDSLVPRGSDLERRTLLLIYIHGFLGNETSFQSFPAHVHNLATHLLKDTHTVHTKIYPRYKSRKAINFARDDFSKWLRPHESAETDVVLLGHSMGGILSADVVLSPLNHRILGTINFDTPFLGMHPGVVVSGIGSLFRPGDATPQPQSQDQGSQALLPIPNGDYVLGKPQNNGSILQQVSNNEYSVPSQFSSPGPSSPALSTSLSSPLSGVSNPMNDPNYNPRFENDVVLPVRKGWDSALHFVMKHSDGLTKATKEYVTSHLEFSGTMADYKGLRTRYEQIRALEDIDDRRTTASQYRSTRRVRFVNYYTASTGRISKPKSSSPVRHGQTKAHQESSIDNEMQDLQLATTSSASRPESLHPVDESQTQQSKSTQDKTNADSDEHSETKSVPESDPDMEHVDPMPLVEDDEPDRLEEGPSRKPTDDSGITRAESTKSSSQAPLNLPPIPPEPSKPEDFDPNTYEDKDVRKLAEKEHARKMKAYSRDVKDREKAVSSRQKMIEKREKNARKAEEKVLKEEKKIQAKEEKEKKKRIAAEETEAAPNATRVSTETSQAKNDATSHEDKGKGKVKRDRKFCILPSKGANGERDPIWIRVFMEGLDEVGAHCGLFFVDRPHYTQFVTNVGEKLKEWVERDRMIREER